MTEREIEQILRRWQRRMGLERWDVELDFGNPVNPGSSAEKEEHPYAEVSYPSNYESAVIKLNANWPEWSPERAEGTIVHELVHLWTRDLEDEIWYQRLEAAVELITRRVIAIAGEGR